MTEAATAEPVSFAHLSGIREPSTALGGTVPVPTPDQQAEEVEVDEDEDMKKAREAEEKKAKKARRAKKARKRDDDDDGEDDSDDADDDEEDEEEDMKASSVTGRARRRERARCMAIFAHEAATGNAALAAHFAFNTTMPRRQAIAALKAAVAAMGPRGRAGLDTRMANASVPVIGADAQPKPTGHLAVADEIVRNYEAARGLKRK